MDGWKSGWEYEWVELVKRVIRWIEYLHKFTCNSNHSHHPLPLPPSSIGPGHLDMIFEYSEWVFKQYPQEALAVCSSSFLPSFLPSFLIHSIHPFSSIHSFVHLFFIHSIPCSLIRFFSHSCVHSLTHIFMVSNTSSIHSLFFHFSSKTSFIYPSIYSSILPSDLHRGLRRGEGSTT